MLVAKLALSGNAEHVQGDSGLVMVNQEMLRQRKRYDNRTADNASPTRMLPPSLRSKTNQQPAPRQSPPSGASGPPHRQQHHIAGGHHRVKAGVHHHLQCLTALSS